MKKLEDVDKNLKVETSINKPDIVFHDIKEEPFVINGVFHENGKYRRMPEAVSKTVSEGVYFLHANTAGGRVRFKTDSKYVAISAKMGEGEHFPHMALTGVAGFDIYTRIDGEERYKATFTPPIDFVDGYESVTDFETEEVRDITINFPLYYEVCELYIGLSENAKILAPTKYNTEKPIVYYGSSITQGGCASRPGMSYQAILTRRFNCDHMNLGFSGAGKGEAAMIEYLSSVEMSVFVMDYDHNAPTAEHLMVTHEKLFKAVRENHPDIPIIIMSMPVYYLNDIQKKRRDIIRQTYENAVKDGDKNVYFIPGNTLMKYAKGEGTVDSCHPNELGFYSMAKVLGDLIEKEKLL